MTSTELKAKLEKALETVEKKKSTIERHKKQAEKKLKEINKKGEEYWLICDYENKLKDIECAKEKLKESEKIANNWKIKLEKQIEKENKITNVIPEAFKQAKETLVEEWVKYDINARETMLKLKKELNYEEFRKIYKYTQEEILKHTDEEFREIEEKEAENWLLNLYNRVVEKTGEITDCSNIHWGGKCLDGFIIGKKGKAIVETIGAGGYNIQKYHLRTLVK